MIKSLYAALLLILLVSVADAQTAGTTQIGQLPVAPALTGSEQIPIQVPGASACVTTGYTCQTSPSAFLTYVEGNLSIPLTVLQIPTSGTLINIGAGIGYEGITGISITSGGGTSPTIAGLNTFFFEVTEGTGTPTSTLIVHMPTVANDWGCEVTDRSSNTITARQNGLTSGNTVIIYFSTAPAANDLIQFKCLGR